MNLVESLETILNVINDAELLIEALEMTPEEWKQFDNAIEYVEDYLIETQICRSVKLGAS